MARYRDVDWTLPADAIGTWERVNTAILMDIRDELKRLNSLLHCSNFTAIPFKLDAIRNNTTPKKKRPKLSAVKRRAA